MYAFPEFWKANDRGGGTGGAKDAGAPDPAAAAAQRDEVGILESPFVHWVANLDATDCLRLDLRIGREVVRREAARLVVRARFARLWPPEVDSEQRYQAFDEVAGALPAAELKLRSVRAL